MHFLTTPINSLHFFQLLATSNFLHLKNHNNICTHPNYIPNLISCKKVMGNCIETLKNSPETEKNRIDHEEAAKSEVENGREKSNNVRIKIVLTKEELEWLMFQLQKSEGKKIEDVLGEIQRSRERTTEGWKPSLDSIVESPEVPEGMDR